jgi:amino-acid N-acetyltransferase
VNAFVIRTAAATDAPALHALISSHQAEGHLLPRDIDDVARHAAHFVVCEVDGEIKACGELAPLSRRVAEVRSLVVSRDYRRVGVAARLVGELRARAKQAGFESLCAFTHDAAFFVRHDFSIVPHVWLPEKLGKDCYGCPLFRRCGQHAMLLPLKDVVRSGVTDVVTRQAAVA